MQTPTACAHPSARADSPGAPPASPHSRRPPRFTGPAFPHARRRRLPSGLRAGRVPPGLLAALALILTGALTACTSEGGRAGSTRAEAAGARVHPSAKPATRSPSRHTSAPAAAPATPAAGARAAGRSYCGPSQDVEEIVVEQWPDGRFRISLRPTDASRRGVRDRTTAVLWAAIGACVPNLGGPQVADSLHAQLTCHQALAEAPSLHGGGYATGDTYDLESWRPLMTPNSFSTWISTHCGNTLGTDPTGPPARTFRPDGKPITHTATGEHA